MSPSRGTLSRRRGWSAARTAAFCRSTANLFQIIRPNVQNVLDLCVPNKGFRNVRRHDANIAVAPFVHPKVGGRTVPNKGYQTKSYTPVLIAIFFSSLLLQKDSQLAESGFQGFRRHAVRQGQPVGEDGKSEIDAAIDRLFPETK